MSTGSGGGGSSQIKQRKPLKVNSNGKKAKAMAKTTTSARKTSASIYDKEEMSNYVLWRRPVQTLYFFVLELVEIVVTNFLKFLNYRKTVVSLLALCGLITLGFYTEGAHLPILHYLRKKILWSSYWVGLGVASSIGLGTGLHTFLLYLGPFIAQVTLAAYECGSLKFPEPPYPEDIICPSNSNKTLSGSDTDASSSFADNTTTMALVSSISILSIMSKVRLESFMWGAGTAIGELPPYFMARASALSASADHNDGEGDEELEEFASLMEAEKKGAIKDVSLVDRMRLSVFKIIKKVGFWGILLCASIPNPLFDLAGITCGHFLVRFWTFFGATLIGKAIIKMHIQLIFVIFLFSQHHLDTLFALVAKMPYVGERAQTLFQEWLNGEKTKLHRAKSGASGANVPGESLLSWVLGKIVLTMIIFFVVSIVNSLAQRRYKRLNTPTHVMKKIASD
jgi:vacuole membrane protein 1